MLHIETIDLYDRYAAERKGPGGQLTVYALQPIPKVDPNRRFPAVLILPGGAYQWVSPREAEPVAMRFLSRGFSCFILNYSCAPCRFPVALRESAMAMAYIRSEADRLHIDPAKVAALGFSAGGHLCGTLGTLYDRDEVADIAPADRLRPDALILCYPVSVSRGRTHRDSFANLCGVFFIGIFKEELFLRHIVYHMLDDGLLQIYVIPELTDECEFLEIFSLIVGSIIE